MKIFFDTEFVDDGRNLELLAIGMVREDGAKYYTETMSAELLIKDHLSMTAPSKETTSWLMNNVAPHLKLGNAIQIRSVIRQQLITFCGEAPEFWAYYDEYDWVILSQLYGSLTERPNGWPMRCNDVMQVFEQLGLPGEPTDYVPSHKHEHNALSDALWTRDLYDFCMKAWRETWG